MALAIVSVAGGLTFSVASAPGCGRSGCTTASIGAPQELHATRGPGTGAITLDWQAPASGSGIVGYRIYRGVKADDVAAVASVSKDTFTFVDTGLADLTSYYYQVAALTKRSEGPRSDLDWARTARVGQVTLASYGFADGLPADWSATGLWHVSTLCGSHPSEPEYLGYHRATACDYQTGLPNRGVALLSVDLSGQGAATLAFDHLWQIACCSDYRDEMRVEARSAPAGTWDLLQQWTASGANQNGWRGVRHSLDPYVGGPAEIRFVFDSIDGLGDHFRGWQLDEVEVLGDVAIALPGPVIGLSAAAGPGVGEITVSWQPPASSGGCAVSSYRVESGPDGTSWSLLATPAAGTTSTTESALGAGETRHYRVRAVDCGGAGPSSTTFASAFDIPDAPQGLVARSGPDAGAITLRFDAPADDGGRAVTHYRIYRGVDGVVFSPIATPTVAQVAAPPGSPSAYRFSDSGLGAGAQWYYRVAALNDVGEGTRSTLAFATTFTGAADPRPLPSARTLTSAAFTGVAGYVAGGLASDGYSLSQMVRFDPATGENTVVADFPWPRHATASAYGQGIGTPGYVYVFFGAALTPPPEGPSPQDCHPQCIVGADIQQFDPVTDSFSSIPTGDGFIPRDSSTSVFVPPESETGGQTLGTGLIYVFGGKENGSGPTLLDCHPQCIVGDDIGVLDPTTGSFTNNAAQLPVPLWGSSGVYFPTDPSDPSSGYVYLFGGQTSSSGPTLQDCHPQCLVGTDIYRFDPRSGTTSAFPNVFPEPLWYTSAVTDGQYAYIFGGQGNDGPHDEIWRFDPQTMSVDLVGTLPSERGGTSAIYAGGAAYVFGGDDGQAPFADVIRFVPGSPQDVRAHPGAGAGEITLSWLPPANAGFAQIEGYNIYAGTSPGGETLFVTLGGDARSFVHSGLPDGATRYYKVSAFSATDEGVQSDEVAATTFRPPGAPRNIRAEIIQPAEDVKLDWDPPFDTGDAPLTAYRIERQTVLGDGFATIAEVPGNTTTFIDPTCTAGMVCDYRVRAVNVVGAGPPSAVVRVIGTKAV